MTSPIAALRTIAIDDPGSRGEAGVRATDKPAAALGGARRACARAVERTVARRRHRNAIGSHCVNLVGGSDGEPGIVEPWGLVPTWVGDEEDFARSARSRGETTLRPRVALDAFLEPARPPRPVGVGQGRRKRASTSCRHTSQEECHRQPSARRALRPQQWQNSMAHSEARAPCLSRAKGGDSAGEWRCVAGEGAQCTRSSPSWPSSRDGTEGSR